MFFSAFLLHSQTLESAHLSPASLLRNCACASYGGITDIFDRDTVGTAGGLLWMPVVQILTKGMLSDGAVAPSPTPRLYYTSARRGRKNNGGKWRQISN